MKWIKYTAVVLLALSTSGCVGLAATMDSLGKDNASVCVTLTTIYGTVKGFRTNIQNGSMSCNQDGMAVRSPAAPTNPQP